MSPAIKRLFLRVGLFFLMMFIVNSLLHYWWDGDVVNFAREARNAGIIAVIFAVVLHFFPQKED